MKKINNIFTKEAIADVNATAQFTGVARQASQTTDVLGEVQETLGAIVTGFSVGGPWGAVAFGAVSLTDNLFDLATYLIDATDSTKQAIKSVEDLGQAQKSLSDAQSAGGQALITLAQRDVAGAQEGVSEQLDEQRERFQELLDELVSPLNIYGLSQTQVLERAAAIETEMAEVRTNIGILENSLAQSQTALLQSNISPIEVTTESNQERIFSPLEVTLNTLFEGLTQALDTEFTELTEALVKAFSQIKCCDDTAKEAVESTSPSEATPQDTQQPKLVEGGYLETLNANASKANASVDGLSNSIAGIGEKVTAATARFNENSIAQEEQAEATEIIAEATDSLTESQTKLGGAASEAKKKLDGIDETVKGALSGVFDKILNGEIDNIGDVFDELFNTIGNDLKNTLATSVQDGDLGGALDGIFGSITEKLELTAQDIEGIFDGIQLGSLIGGQKAGIGNQIGGTIGGLIGKALPIPFGSLIGSTVGSFLGGLFGSKPSDKTEGVKLNFDTGARSEFDLGPKKDSPENREAANAFAERMAEFVRKLEEISGGSVSLRGGNDFSIGVGSRDGIDVSFGSTVRRNFKTIEQAWDFSVEHISENLTGIPEEVQAAIKSIDFKGDVDRALGLVDIAVNFENIILALNEGTRNVADTLIGAAQTEAKDVLDFVKQFKADTAELFPGSANTNTQNTPDFFDLGDFGYGIDQQAIIDAYNNYHGITNQVADAVAEVSEETKAAEAATRAYVESLFETKEPVSEIQSAVDQLNTRFEAFNDVFAEVGITAEDAADMLEAAMASMRSVFGRDLDVLFNEVTDKGYLNSINDILAQYQQLNADAATLNFETEKIDAIFGAQLESTLKALFGATESAGDAQPILEQIRKTFASYPEILSAANAAFNAHVADLAAIELREELVATWEEQIKGLEEQNRLQETAKSNWESIAESAKSAQLRLLTNPSISRFSAEERASETLRLLEDAFAAAENGDVDAAGRVSELALEAAEANAAFFASSEDFARVNERIEFILKNTETFAQTQVGLLQSILDANLAQIDALRGQIETTNNAPLPSEGPSALERLNALNVKYANALDAFGGSQAAFSQTAEFASFKDQVIDLVGQLNDIDRLKSDHANLSRTAGENSPIGHAHDNIVQAIADRLRALNVPGFATGGVTDGLAIIHPGELLYTGPPARVINAGESAGVMARSGDLVSELRSTRRAIEALNGTVDAANDDQMGGLNRMAMRLGAIESGLELRAARA